MTFNDKEAYKEFLRKKLDDGSEFTEWLIESIADIEYKEGD